MENIGFFKVLGLIGMLSTELSTAAADNRITVREAVGIVEKICAALGIDFDKEGIDLG